MVSLTIIFAVLACILWFFFASSRTAQRWSLSTTSKKALRMQQAVTIALLACEMRQNIVARTENPFHPRKFFFPFLFRFEFGAALYSRLYCKMKTDDRFTMHFELCETLKDVEKPVQRAVFFDTNSCAVTGYGTAKYVEQYLHSQ